MYTVLRCPRYDDSALAAAVIGNVAETVVVVVVVIIIIIKWGNISAAMQHVLLKVMV